MNESAVYEIRLKDSFSSPLKGLESKMNGFENKVGSLKSSVTGLGSAFSSVFGAAAIIGGITALGTKIVSLGAQMEQTRVSFETMLGSSDKATGLITQLQTFARVTPYVTSEVLDAGKQMLAFGFSTGEIIPQLTKLGDVASGLNIPLGDMIYLYGTLKTQGRAMTRDILQFAQRGIPIYDALAKVLGVDKSAVGELVTAGKVGFNQVAKAFELMTAKGSTFGGLMDKQSRTLAGRWSTFLGTLEEIGTVLGEKMIPYLGAVVEEMSYFADILPRLDFSSISDNFADFGDALHDIGEAFGFLSDSVGLSFEGFSIFQLIIQSIGGTIRTILLPIRAFVDFIKLMIDAVHAAAPVFSEFGTLLKNIFTLDFEGANDSAHKLRQLAGDFKNTMGAAIDEVITKEVDGWKKIFKFPGATDANQKASGGLSANGIGGNKSTLLGSDNGKTSSSGVERITAGTRNVTVNINKLLEVNNKNAGEMLDSAFLKKLQKALLTVVNDVNIVAQ